MRTAYVLGAGASISATEQRDGTSSMPATSSVFAEAARRGHVDERKHSHLIDYAKRYFHQDLTDPRNAINAEDLLTNLQLDIERLNSAPDAASMRHAQEIIAHTIRDAQKGSLGKLTGGEYDRLLLRACPDKSAANPILTFNWDILLDQQMAQDDRFDLLRRSLSSGVLQGQRVSQAHRRPAYLKLHGSVDWRRCSVRHCTLANSVNPTMDSTKCSACGNTTDIVIVPPTSNKRLFTDVTIQRAWTIAADHLERASKLVVWGYSLPATDFAARWLLRHIGIEAPLEGVDVIDKCPDPVKGRFMEVLATRVASENVRTFRSFSEWEKAHDS